MILGLSLPINKVARLDKMLSEGLSRFSLSHMVCEGLRGLIPMLVHSVDRYTTSISHDVVHFLLMNI